MTRDELEHVLRAAASIADVAELVVVGSQSILAAFPAATGMLVVSNAVDLFPLREPGRADLIEGAIGEASPFHESFKYFARGVGPETSILPEDWVERCLRIEMAGSPAAALCLEPHDLAVAKLAAGRGKDHEFLVVAIQQGALHFEEIERRTLLVADHRAPQELLDLRLQTLQYRLREAHPPNRSS